MTVAADPETPSTVYAGDQFGLFKSADVGDSWVRLPFPGRNMAVVAVSPVQPSLLLAIDIAREEGQIYHSGDGGQTWDAGR